MRQDKLDFAQRRLGLPQLRSVHPAVAAVAEAVDEDDGGSMLAYGVHDDGRCPCDARGHLVVDRCCCVCCGVGFGADKSGEMGKRGREEAGNKSSNWDNYNAEDNNDPCVAHQSRRQRLLLAVG